LSYKQKHHLAGGVLVYTFIMFSVFCLLREQSDGTGVNARAFLSLFVFKSDDSERQ